MNFKLSAFTRRTFLEGAGAAVAATFAHASLNTLLTDRSLEVAALLDGEASLAALGGVIASPFLSLRAAIVSSAALRAEANNLLRQAAMAVVASDLSLRQTAVLQRRDALLIFGRWQGTEPTLSPVLHRRSAIYVDDPALAMKLGKARSVYFRPERTLVGLISMMDSAVTHAESRLRSGVMGKISDIAVVIRNRDDISELEAAAALRQLAEGKTTPKARRVATLNVKPSIHITCCRGRLNIPLYSAAERTQTLPLWLQHFALVARGEVIPAISLPEMVSLSEWMQREL
jgi:hypothetical protein